MTVFTRESIAVPLGAPKSVSHTPVGEGLPDVKVLFASSEVAPFSKTGGLADVAGALPARLRDAGHDVRTVTPLHRSIDRSGLDEAGSVHTTRVGDRRIEWSLRHHRASDTFLVDCDELFDRPNFYTHDPDEHIRWAALSRIVVELAAEGGADIVHCNDWQTGLVPLWAPEDLPSVLTIHNLGYQGWFGPEAVAEIGLTAETPVSFLATGIRQADVVTTVSPTYAREIQTPEGGAGLHSLLQTRSADLVGILNGIDVDEWNPRTDRRIARNYGARSLDRKKENTRALLRQVGLPDADGSPTVVMVSRLVEQKGLDIMQGPLAHFLSTWDMRVIVLGSGDDGYERMLAELAGAYPKKMAFVSGYDEDLSHLWRQGATSS
jgi:starch synthase